MGFPDGSDGKESAGDAGDPGLIPELGRCPGEQNGYPLQHSYLENSMDRGALWWLQSMGLQRVEHYCQLFWKISYVPHKYPVGPTFSVYAAAKTLLLQC